MSYIGNRPNNPQIGPASSTTITATTLQTVFSIAYTPGFITVFQNGALLVPFSDYTTNAGTSVTLVTGATVGDELTFIVGNAVANGEVVTATTATFATNAATATNAVTANNATLAATATNALSLGGTLAANYSLVANSVSSVNGTTGPVQGVVFDAPTDGENYLRAGSAWVVSVAPIDRVPQMLVITSTQTWAPPVGVTRAKLTVIGGGGASGTATSQVGGGGGGGGSAVSVLTVSSATTYTATVGAGGAAAAQSGNLNGNAGGASSFSGSGITTMTANGGGGGQSYQGNVGGTATGGQINIPGGSGNGSATNNNTPPPHGGETLLSPRTVQPGSGGLAGQGFGAGGVAPFNATTTFAGAAGVIVIEF